MNKKLGPQSKLQKKRRRRRLEMEVKSLRIVKSSTQKKIVEMHSLTMNSMMTIQIFFSTTLPETVAVVDLVAEKCQVGCRKCKMRMLIEKT